MLVSLATDVADPVERLDAISESARVAKEQEKLHRGRLIGELAQVAPPALAARGGAGHGRLPALRQDAPAGQCDRLERRVPPAIVLCGSRVVDMYPVGPMAEGMGLNVTVFSYLERVYFGVLACRKLVPELEQWRFTWTTSLAELVACALDCPGGDGLRFTAPRLWSSRGSGHAR